jgi:EpsI family protein
MRYQAKFIVMLLLMLVAASVAWALRPTAFLADQRPKVNLERLIPGSFGDWSELKRSNAQIINPQQAELLTKIYSQTLSRTYVNAQGEMIMLSIAYGSNQSDALQLHYPEVCYPAQGFQIIANVKGELDTGAQKIPVRRLVAVLGQRREPVTYWTTLGNQVVQGRLDTKFTQMRYAINGQIPDGLLFRVSSITRDDKAGYATQEEFAVQLVTAIAPQQRLLLVGEPMEDRAKEATGL